MLEAYREHVKERAREGIDPKPLNAEQVNQLVELLKNPPESETDTLLDLLENRIPAGVDDAAYVKAAFINGISCSLSPEKLLATKLAPKFKAMPTKSIGGNKLSSPYLLFDSKSLVAEN